VEIKQICKICGIEYPLTSEFFVKNCAMKNGFRIICKICLHKKKMDDYYNTPKEISKERQHISYMKYSECRKLKAKEYRDDPINHVRLMEKAKLRRRTIPEVKLAIYCRNRINSVLKGKKKESLNKLVGCDINELKYYLEKQFKFGMSWDNWKLDGWHIDHIKPCCTFNLQDVNEMKKCFHYTNLQPLWWYENLSKPKNKFGNESY
jgi:hypothetical protein